jgi:hypothetical protein
MTDFLGRQRLVEAQAAQVPHRERQKAAGFFRRTGGD